MAERSAGYRSWKTGDEEDGTPAYEVLETYKGKDLEYKEYEPLYALCSRMLQQNSIRKHYYVTCDDLCNADRWYRCRSYCTGIW